MLTLCLMIFLHGCATTPGTCEPVVQYETRTVYQDKIVPVPEHMLPAVEVPELEYGSDTYALAAAFKQCKIRLQQANGLLDGVRSLER